MKFIKLQIYITALIFIFLVFTSFHSTAKAEDSQTNFTISPSPIPWFEFYKGKGDAKLGMNAVSVSGNDMSLWGLGAQGIMRYAITDYFAVDGGMGFMAMTGTYSGGSIDMDMNTISGNIPLDLEIQLFRNSDFVLLMFGGINPGVMTTEMTYTDNEKNSMTIESWIYGLIAGIQASVAFTGFVFTPFAMIQRVSGVTYMDGYETIGGEQFSTIVKEDIPAYISKTFGFDIAYKPMSIVLSTMLQMVPGTGDNSGFKTYTFCISRNFQFEKNQQENGNTNTLPDDI